MKVENTNIKEELQSAIMRMQGFKPASDKHVNPGLEPFLNCFPNSIFPVGAVHEFLSGSSEDSAATTGFISALLKTIMDAGACLWISKSRTLFPPALKNFGIDPDQFIFIDSKKERDVLWTMEEGLKCPGLTAVIGELNELTFTESRRLQLAVEHSHTTGFIIRHNPQKINTTACVSRWKISSLISDTFDDLPGIGFPKWRVELLRMRNGKSGAWDLQWINGNFVTPGKLAAVQELHQKAG
jgi:protein ImuA